MTDYPMNWEGAVSWLRHQPDKQQLVRDCYYDDPLLKAAERFRESVEWAAIRAELGEARGRRALDLGAGRGIAAYALAKDGWEVTALEPDPSDLVGAGAISALMAEAELSVEIVTEWGESLPFADASFDAVHCRQALHHAADLNQMLVEIGRVLKPDGLFIATREHVLSKREDLDAFLKSHPLHHLYGGENAFTLDEYRDAIATAGIVLDKCLNPLASEINTSPRTRHEIKGGIASRFRFPFPSLVPDWLVAWLGSRSDAPGRPYTFVGHKPRGSGGR
ncbi:class I SAM-dependent methyltransferase [Pelagibius sp. CAU 1746]|uniref:class I SAM-dependent methyltransferase n=1 Tax=Pelagibius sp. CAU 1746 TaxID=3140370 RepID=UPI00325B7F76